MQAKQSPTKGDQKAQYDDAALLTLIKDTIPTKKDKKLIQATVLEIGERNVLFNTTCKSDGVISLNEFKDMPNLKIGDKVEVYIENEEDRNGNHIISRKKAKKLRAWQTIEDAYHAKTSLLGKIKGRVKGGLEVDINGITVFLPGSQVDTNPVKDFDALLNQSFELMVLSIKPEKKNAVVSRRALLEKAQRALIESLKAGQDKQIVLEGIVKNIINIGVFVELAAGIVGLVYVKETVWDKKITHPDQAKDQDGNPLFVIGKPVKVVVKGFEPQEGSYLPRIALSTKALLPNPWDALPENVEVGSVVKGRVTEIKDRGICVTIQEDIKGFVHISEMSFSSYIQNPSEIVALDQELSLEVLKIDREEQDLRLGMKQLMKDPWQNENFFEKYGLNTHHKGIVRRYAEKNKGVYVEIEPGVEGYLDNEHISWTKKILRANDYFELGKTHEVLILGMNEEDKMLKLGMRELEDSPWNAFEETFVVGSDHDAIVKSKYRTGTVIELPYGLEAFVPNKELTKKDDSPIQEGEILKVRVIDFIKYEHKVMVSHAATYKEGLASSEVKKSKNVVHTVNKTTLSDLSALSKLKEKLVAQNQTKEQSEGKADEKKEEKVSETTTTQAVKAKKEEKPAKEEKEEKQAKKVKDRKETTAAEKTKSTKAVKEKNEEQEKEEETK